MKQSHIAALVLGVASITAGTAMAQSAKTNPWEGADVSLGIGYGQFSPTLSNGTASGPVIFGLTGGASSSLPITTSIDNLQTPTGNISAGYNWGITSQFLLGLRASFYPGASASAKGSYTVPSLQSPYNQPSPLQYHIKNLYSIVLTPGYALDKERLIYAKVGYTGVTAGLNSPTLPYSTVGLTGYTLGAGYKQMVDSSLYLFAEFNYGKYSDTQATVTDIRQTNLSATFNGSGMDLLIGVGYRF